MAKRIGTRIVGSAHLDCFEKIIWLTPAIKDEFVTEAIKLKRNKSLVIIGDKDPFYDKGLVSEILGHDVACEVIKGADHGLDNDSDLNESLDNMKLILNSIKKFIML
jgi:hypothetical protein